MKILQTYRYMREMADRLVDIKQDLRNCSENLRDHLIMLFMFRNNVNVNHWKNEVYGACHSVSKAKHNHKYPKSSFIYQELWGYYEDGFYDKCYSHVESLEDKENLVAPLFEPTVMYHFLDSYFVWLSKSLSARGEVSSKEIKSKIDALLTDYTL